MTWQQKIWNDPVGSKVIAAVVIAGGGAALVAIARADPVWLTILVAVIVIGVVLLLWVFFRNPIAWKFNGFLSMVGGGGDLRIIGFQASGRNRSSRGFTSIQGHLVSNLDNSVSDSLHFVIHGVPVLPSATTGISPAAAFQVMVPLCDQRKGYDAYLTEHDFRRRWNSFRFVAEVDGHRSERNFSQRKVSRVIENFRRVANSPPKPEVRSEKPPSAPR
jgi:hypothetical protein